jgi:hypothetical protein
MRSIEVFIQGPGLSEIAVLKVGAHETVAEVIARVVQPNGGGEEMFVFLEDVHAPLEIDAVMEELVALTASEDVDLDPIRLHVGHCRHVDVAVRFNNETARRRFSPSATIERVQRWASLHAFHMTPRDAAEHVLQIQGTAERPDREVHIGTLIKKGAPCAIAFDLVPAKRVEG